MAPSKLSDEIPKDWKQSMDLRYPVGKFQYETLNTDSQRQDLISQIESLPENIRKAIKGLSPEQLETPYRPDGWMVRQVVHHTADSHMNAFIRFKLALTEEDPTIKPYEETRWAELEDGRNAPIELSVTMLDSLHARWIILLKSLKETDYSRTFKHPEMGPMNLDKTLSLYAWHGRHHVAHITSLRERMGWQ
ncbi:MAG TPA: putative metal-dependent hydrolase [Nitrososphaera sp.]|nr:putative metal-dependent hydrolase [Nitrososphaera sp.]